MKFCPKCGAPRSANFCGKCGFAFNPTAATSPAIAQHTAKLIPGWYPDQINIGFERLWDGDAWTSQLRPIASAQQAGPAISTTPGTLSQSLPQEETSLEYGDGFSPSLHCINCGTPKTHGASSCTLCGA